jgi:hypothetical protein
MTFWVSSSQDDIMARGRKPDNKGGKSRASGRNLKK